MIQAQHHILESEKEVSDQFRFLQRNNIEELNNLITGDPKIPLIGKYSRNQYHFLNVDSLIQFDLEEQQGQYFTQLTERFVPHKINLPKSVLDIINNIPEQINHNKPPPKQQQQNQKKNNKKQNKKIDDYFQQKEKQQDQQDEEVHPNFHPIRFEQSKKLKFTWTISSLKDNKILIPLKQEPCLSYVNHNWVFEIINFENQKKQVAFIPICVLDPFNIFEYTDQYKGINFFQLRSEYMSIHMGQGGALCFSPNNMKVMINLKDSLASFWTVILQEDKKHHIYHHWIILNEDLSQISQQISQNSKNINQLVENYQMLGGQFEQAIDVIKHVFNI